MRRVTTVQIERGIVEELRIVASAVGRTIADLASSGIRREIEALTRGDEGLRKLVDDLYAYQKKRSK